MMILWVRWPRIQKIALTKNNRQKVEIKKIQKTQKGDPNKIER